LYKDPKGDFNIASNSPAVSGSAKAFAYLDENYNNKFDKKEQIIKDARFTKGSTPLEKLDKKYSYVRGITEFYPTEIKFLPGSLEDPLWYPSEEGYNVVTRAGVTAEIALPVIKTSELDGSVYLEEAEGAVNSAPEAVSGLKIFLLDEKGNKVAESTSEFDGYFMFEKIKPNKYFLVVSEDQLSQLSLEQQAMVEVSVGKDQDYYSDNNITVLRADESSTQTENSDSESLELIDINGPSLIEDEEDFVGPKPPIYGPVPDYGPKPQEPIKINRVKRSIEGLAEYNYE
jgi:hypothetical protein